MNEARIHMHQTGSATGVGTYVDGLTNALQEHGHRVMHTRTEKRERVVLGKKVGGYLSQVPGNWSRKPLPGSTLMHATCNWSLSSHAKSVMIHDINPLLLPELGTARAMFTWQKAGLRRRVLLVPSQATKEGVMRWLKISPDSVHVAPHGIDHALFKPTKGYDPGHSYLVYAGDYRPYKRIEEGIKVAKRNGWGFVRVGPPGVTAYARSVQEHGERLLGAQWHDLGYVDRDQLPGIYTGAEAMWFASRWEGFGLPPLEAAACGTPSILADAPVARELHGELGVYVNGHVPTRSIIHDAQRPRELQANTQKYTWQRSAEAHLAAWRQGGLL